MDFQSRYDIGLLQICLIKSAEPQRIRYGVQGFEYPTLLHVSKQRPYFVWSLAGPTSICIVMYLLIMLGYGFIPWQICSSCQAVNWTSLLHFFMLSHGNVE